MPSRLLRFLPLLFDTSSLPLRAFSVSRARNYAHAKYPVVGSMCCSQFVSVRQPLVVPRASVRRPWRNIAGSANLVCSACKMSCLAPDVPPGMQLYFSSARFQQRPTSHANHHPVPSARSIFVCCALDPTPGLVTSHLDATGCSPCAGHAQYVRQTLHIIMRQ